MLERRRVTQQTVDRRSKNRIYTEFNIATFINDQEFKTQVRNLSCSGIQIVEPLDSGIANYQNCRIRITNNKSAQDIELEARVIWKRFGLMGLSFQDLNKPDKQGLDQLLTLIFKESVATNGMAALG